MPKSIVAVVKDICHLELDRGGVISKHYLQNFLHLFDGNLEDSQVVEQLMQLLNVMVPSRWSSSTTPTAFVSFPVHRESISSPHEPWNVFEWTHQGPGGSLAFSLWISIERNLRRPTPIFSVGNNDLMLDVVLHERSLAFSVTAKKILIGGTKFEPIGSIDASWCQLAVNCTLEADVVRLEIFLDGDLVRNDSINVKAAGLSQDILNRFPSSVQIGSATNETDLECCWRYAQAWLFAKCLTRQQWTSLYLMGPSFHSLDEPLFPFRSEIVRKVLIKDPRRTPTILGRKTLELKERESLKNELFALHRAGESSLLIFHPAKKSTSSRLTNIFGNSNPSNGTTCQELIAGKSLEIGDDLVSLIEGSWFDALQSSGGVALLLLVVARVIESGAGDAAVALALDALLTASEESIHEVLEPSLLKKVLLQSSQIGLFSLQVMLRHAVTRNFLGHDPDRDAFAFLPDQAGVVYNGPLFALIVDLSPLWKSSARSAVNEEFLSCWEVLLCCIQGLVQDTHVLR